MALLGVARLDAVWDSLSGGEVAIDIGDPVRAGEASADVLGILRSQGTLITRSMLDRCVEACSGSAEKESLIAALERGTDAKLFCTGLRCPSTGQPLVCNEDVVGKSFPIMRNYGACDICEERGTRFRCQASDYDLCWRSACAAAVPAPPSQLPPPAVVLSIIAAAIALGAAYRGSRL